MREDQEYAPYEGEELVSIYDDKKIEFGYLYKCPFCKQDRSFGMGCSTCRVKDKKPKTEIEIQKLREWLESICTCGHQRNGHFSDKYGCTECFKEERTCPCWGFVDKGWVKARFYKEWHFKRIEIYDEIRRAKEYMIENREYRIQHNDFVSHRFMRQKEASK